MLRLNLHNLLEWNVEGLLGSYKATTLDEFWIGLLAFEAILITSVLGLRALEAIGRRVQKSRWNRSRGVLL
ncbi:uncharacterized protein GGS22DRAFT_154513 [Annulohypoxylon maeteangense]|uniref:uncharacterized protein n=1 Tax=Annulohypoxylon maeteangense TaxID=1927788 RepID=UPI0020072649|nr:uncharacterized protein GGS22DRAFT_154513 [Annulohypoxylon maeteangense]KAI0887893.1 hypothetical protein GGS22DRAFT_154513 [Annulohypoxylon maeteangense]